MIKAYAELSQNQQYTRKAIQQAVDSGMNKKDARALVNRNANTRTRTSNRQNYVNRVLG